MAKQSLGRGFDALIPKELDSSILEEDSSRIQKILIDDIKPNPDQPRRDFDAENINDLANSIKRHGVLQPIIVVRQKGSDGYRIVAGERRWRAAKHAKLSHMPAIVRSLKELEQIELALIENIQRVDLSPLEQALSVYRLQHQFNLTLEEISQKLGKAQSTVSNLARLLKLPQQAQDALRRNKISEGHARTILSLAGNPIKQDELLSSILDNGWNVRKAEEFASSTKKVKNTGNLPQKTAQKDGISKALEAQLGVPVRIKRTRTGGQLIIAFKSDQDLVQVLKKLKDISE